MRNPNLMYSCKKCTAVLENCDGSSKMKLSDHLIQQVHFRKKPPNWKQGLQEDLLPMLNEALLMMLKSMTQSVSTDTPVSLHTMSYLADACYNMNEPQTLSYLNKT